MGNLFFTAVLVSRSRPKMLYDLYRSILDTAAFDTQMIVGLDIDDPLLPEYFDLFRDVENVTLVVSRRLANLHTRINDLLPLIKSRYILVLNDDCLLRQNDWDKYAVDVLDSFGSIVYGITNDNSIDKVGEYASFPVVSKTAADTLGFIMDNTFGNHGSDVITYRIYQEAGKVVDLPNLQIDHVLHNSVESLLMRSLDKTAVDMANRTYSDENFSVSNLFNCDVSSRSGRIM